MVLRLPGLAPMQQGSKTNVPTGPPCPRCKRRPTRLVDAADMRTTKGEVQRLSKYRKIVALAAIERARSKCWKPLEGGVGLRVDVSYPRPTAHLLKRGGLAKGKPFHKISAPDMDKLVRAIGDALTESGVVWSDDAQVVQLIARKRYAGFERDAGVVVAIEDLDLDEVSEEDLAWGWEL